MEAEVVLEYDCSRVATAVAGAVSPDNSKAPSGLSIKTATGKRKVITRIGYEGKLPTFIATIDDLLFCVSIAEKALQMTRKLE